MPGEATIDISEARRRFNSLDEQLTSDSILYVTRHNKRAFAIVNVDLIEAIMETLEIMSDPQSYQMFVKSLEDIASGRVHDQEDVERELG